MKRKKKAPVISDGEFIRVLRFLSLRWLHDYWLTWKRKDQTRAEYIALIKKYKEKADG